MSFDRLIVFAAVAKHRNVSHASRQLHLSQPAVTKQIKLLEKEYNATLFTRYERGVELTDRGKAFLRDVTRLIKRYEKLREKFGAVNFQSSGRPLSVGGSHSPSVSFLPSILARFQKSHPDVQLNLRTDTKSAVERMVVTGEVELAVINNPPLNSQLTMEPLRCEPIVAFVSPDHPLAKKRQLDWNDFARVGFIIRKDLTTKGNSRGVIQHLKNTACKPNVALQCDSPTAVKEAVRKKLGVGILYREVVMDDIARGELIAMNMPGDAFEGKSFIIYHKHRPLSSYAMEFLTLLRRYKQ